MVIAAMLSRQGVLRPYQEVEQLPGEHWAPHRANLDTTRACQAGESEPAAAHRDSVALRAARHGRRSNICSKNLTIGGWAWVTFA